MTPDSMGFESFGRTEAMAWLPLSGKSEALALAQNPLTKEDIDEGVVAEHLSFIKRRKLCFLYTVDSSGGTLLLHPRSDLGLDTVKVPIVKSHLVVFRCDMY